ncbi:FliG C-terminal domain-containing protein [Clostridium faecium]|uniref:Flagellar motor switch protein FliG C-terminal domain-containing protein n=1 Tax=Clostridium faecium TaxID=2762223 RepID=A0ABR8YVJ7_9CLOT|nr:FliG C-terminal domain-containing protein [Clostridium faecium]MBD8047874.1 hypothetical protein [Clostridium faecium]
MYMTSFIYSLPNDLRVKYYESILKNGETCDDIWNEIVLYLEKSFKTIDNVEEEMEKILKDIDDNDKNQLLNLIYKNNKHLYEELSEYLYNFEEIVNINQELVKKVLENYNTEEIYKATKAVSPNTKEFINSLMKERDFTSAKDSVGNVPISEIMDIHSRIIKDINNIRCGNK